MSPDLAEHLGALRGQAAGTRRALRATSSLLELLLDRPDTAITPGEIDQLRRQSRSGMKALRLTNQLLAQAAELIEHDHTTAEEAHDNASKTEDRSAHVG